MRVRCSLAEVEIMFDPAEQAAREHPKHLHYQFCRIHSEHKPFCTCGLDDYILTRERAVRLEERERIIRLLCPWCARQDPFIAKDECLALGHPPGPCHLYNSKELTHIGCKAAFLTAESLRRAPAGDGPFTEKGKAAAHERRDIGPSPSRVNPAGDAGQRCVICREPTQDAEDVMFTPHGEQVCSRCIADIQARRPEPDAAPGGGDE